MPNWIENIVTVKPNYDIGGTIKDVESLVHHISNTKLEEIPGKPLLFDFNTIVKEPEDDTHDWYEWRVKNWGTKWNADNTELEQNKDSSVLRFCTAWTNPRPVIDKLARMFPKCIIKHEYADEDILGIHCGEAIYNGNSRRVIDYHDSDDGWGNKDAVEFALRVWGYDCEDVNLIYDEKTNSYVGHDYSEEEKEKDNNV